MNDVRCGYTANKGTQDVGGGRREKNKAYSYFRRVAVFFNPAFIVGFTFTIRICFEIARWGPNTINSSVVCFTLA